jgi:hypothetical protein
MRTTLKILNTAVLVITTTLFFALAGCKKDDPAPETPATDVVKLLTSGSWKIQRVTVDGVDASSRFAGLALSFTESGFTATSGNVVWPATGTWAFTDSSQKSITRNDGLVVTLEEITSTKLSLKLTWAKTTLSGGRTSSVAGTHTFIFGK